MSTVCALKIEGGVILGSDTQETQDDIALHLHSHPKWIVRGNHAIGAAGIARTLNQIHGKVDEILKGEPGPVALADRLIQLLKDSGYTPRTEKMYLPDWGQNIIYVQEGQIWEYDECFSWSPVDHFSAIGSGKCFAMATESALRDQRISPLDRMKRALEVACRFDVNSGGALFIDTLQASAQDAHGQ